MSGAPGKDPEKAKGDADAPSKEGGQGEQGTAQGPSKAPAAAVAPIKEGTQTAQAPPDAPPAKVEAGDAALPGVARMTEPHVEKIVVNIGVGEAGEKLAKAEKVLEMITHQKAVRTISKTTNKDLGIRWGMPLGCKVTIRKKAAAEFLKTALWVKENRITSYSFDPEGNFSFGITDYTDFPGQKYSPDIGIFGMDVCVVLSRPGRRVSVRTHARRRIPRRHRLTRQEALDWLKRKYGVEVVE